MPRKQQLGKKKPAKPTAPKGQKRGKAAPKPARPVTPARAKRKTGQKSAPETALASRQKGKRGGQKGNPLANGKNATGAKLGGKKRKRRKAARKAAPKPARPTYPNRRWYVISVGIGQDDKVRKELNKNKLLNFSNRIIQRKHIGQLFSPYHLEEIKLPKTGECIANGKEIDVREARIAGNSRAWLEHDPHRDCSHDTPCPPGYRVQVFPAKSQTPGKIGNGWEWKVIREIETTEQTVLRKRKKFPGYLIVHCELTTNVFHLLTSPKGVECILMSNEQPTPMESQEAAELLIERTLVNKTIKEKKAVELDYKIGDVVRCMDGTWKNRVGIVKEISGEKNDPTITVEFILIGQPVTVNIRHYLLIKRN